MSLNFCFVGTCVLWFKNTNISKKLNKSTKYFIFYFAAVLGNSVRY